MSSLFGGSTPQISYTPKGFSNPLGYGVSGGGKVSESPGLAANIGGLQSTFGQAAGAFGALGQTVAPGFSQFRQAGLGDITSTFQAARSNLSDNLAQRRILGSSFANSAFSQSAADEAQTKANFEAQSYLQELSASQQLIQQQFNAQAASFSTAIQQSNIESASAASLTATNNQIGAAIATANAQLIAKSQEGAGSFFGMLGGSLFKGAGTNALGSLGSMFGGTTAAGTAGAGIDFGSAAALGGGDATLAASLALL
jgi:hypothetical protein